MTDSVIISDPARSPIVAQRHNGKAGGVALRGQFHSVVVLSAAELDRLVAFARSDEPPRLGKLQRFPCPDPAVVERNFIE
jgi:hypothetical protein